MNSEAKGWRTPAASIAARSSSSEEESLSDAGRALLPRVERDERMGAEAGTEEREGRRGEESESEEEEEEEELHSRRDFVFLDDGLLSSSLCDSSSLFSLFALFFFFFRAGVLARARLDVDRPARGDAAALNDGS